MSLTGNVLPMTTKFAALFRLTFLYSAITSMFLLLIFGSWTDMFATAFVTPFAGFEEEASCLDLGVEAMGRQLASFVQLWCDHRILPV